MTRKDRRNGDWRESQPDHDGPRAGEHELQEGESPAALKTILAKVAGLLRPLQLTQEESVHLVERLYEAVLEMDVRLAGEADDTRRSSVHSHIQNASVRREGDKIVVEFADAGGDASVNPGEGKRE